MIRTRKINWLTNWRQRLLWIKVKLLDKCLGAELIITHQPLWITMEETTIWISKNLWMIYLVARSCLNLITHRSKKGLNHMNEFNLLKHLTHTQVNLKISISRKISTLWGQDHLQKLIKTIKILIKSLKIGSENCPKIISKKNCSNNNQRSTICQERYLKTTILLKLIYQMNIKRIGERTSMTKTVVFNSSLQRVTEITTTNLSLILIHFKFSISLKTSANSSRAPLIK